MSDLLWSAIFSVIVYYVVKFQKLTFNSFFTKNCTTLVWLSKWCKIQYLKILFIFTIYSFIFNICSLTFNICLFTFNICLFIFSICLFIFHICLFIFNICMQSVLIFIQVQHNFIKLHLHSTTIFIQNVTFIFYS